GGGDTDAAHPEHVGQKLMRNVEAVGICPVLAHQQPSSQPRPDLVEAKARSRRGQLSHEDVDIAVDAPLQCRAMCELAAKCSSANSPSRARSLHECVQ